MKQYSKTAYLILLTSAVVKTKSSLTNVIHIQYSDIQYARIINNTYVSSEVIISLLIAYPEMVLSQMLVRLIKRFIIFTEYRCHFIN